METAKKAVSQAADIASMRSTPVEEITIGQLSDFVEYNEYEIQIRPMRSPSERKTGYRCVVVGKDGDEIAEATHRTPVGAMIAAIKTIWLQCR